ncbi:L,D-transpeptidase [Okeania sp.]|uniref:L,D-transpeptidase n=1 Tax=Okeania sp. TaxID=3100323 RepID=UPI002B4AD398|nr:L,D-transpeptidase [Okeania sp.]MEB3343738.1 L,D-transpeptidase [Okeania sp.]
MTKFTTNKWLYLISKISKGTYNLSVILLTTAVILFSENLAIASTPLVAQARMDNPEIQAEKLVRLVLRLGERRVYVYEGEQQVASYPVAVGKPGWETPTGNFKVIQKVENPEWENPWTGEVMPAGPNTALGLRWIGFWTDGKDTIGFHGTPTVDSIGYAASHGCVRMYNEHVVKLFEQVQVGTSVVVEP